MAAASVRLAAPSLPRMLDTCTLAVFGAMNSTEAISRLLRPAAMSRSTSRSRLVSDASRAPSGGSSGAVPILARRPRSSSARRSGLAPQPVRRLRGQPPLLFGLVPAARLGQRLGQPPPGAGYLVDVGGTERVQDRLPGLRVVVASGPPVFRLGARQPAAALGAQDELGPLGERRPLPGDAQQFPGRGQLRAGGLVIAGGPGLRGPVGPRAQRDRGRPDDRR